MKLCMSLIADWLSRYNCKCAIRDNSPAISAVKWIVEAPIRNDTVYVCRKDDFISPVPAEDAATVVIFRTSTILVYDCTAEEVMNEISDAMEFYRQWEERLSDLVSQEDSLQRMSVSFSWWRRRR